jgi:hypothetical protein
MKTFKIRKQNGTYSDLLETYGFANLLYKILDCANINNTDIFITDKGLYYEVSSEISISDDIISNLVYFPLFKYLKQTSESDMSHYSDYFNYPVQKEWRGERQKLLNEVYIEYVGKGKKSDRDRRIKEIEHIYDSEKRIDSAFDVYSQINSPNNFPSFEKLYQNLSNNKELFPQCVKEILQFYGDEKYNSKDFNKHINNHSFYKTVTATQLYNPHQGQGLNKPKADGLNRKNFDSSWISESMKVSGSLTDMICKLIKVGNGYDLKVFVPEYKQINYRYKDILMPKFKKHISGNTPIVIDILNILLLTQMIIEHSGYTGRRKKVKDIISGLHSVYQKNLGQNKAVVNIGFIQVPNFIEISNEEENQNWLEILQEQRLIIGSIKESGDTAQGLIDYRKFISGSDINSFFRFSYWYAIYLSKQISNKKFTKAFSIETLNQFYKNMDTNELKLFEIISNVGFNAVAGAIRKSTVVLQYTPKENRKYDVRYGIAQTLQNKSKSKEDLAEFVGEFIALYNSETARQSEKTGNSLRASVRENELNDFYALLDKFPSKLIGALLASYGFALKSKDVAKSDEDPQNFMEETIEE